MLPQYVRTIIETLEKEGYSAFAVGGCVRDTLLGRTPNDWDIAASAPDEELIRIFEMTVPTGIKYGTVTVFLEGERAEVTTFRADGEYRDGRHPESVSFGKSLEEDLSRRDFTVNALAMNAKGEITDIFGGRRDMEAKLLRCVGEPEKRFSEDALRMLRAVRFSAQLGFSVERETYAAIKKLSGLAASLSAERVRGEASKTLMSPRPEKISEMISLGLLDAFLDKRTAPDEAEASRIGALPAEEGTRFFAFSALLLKCGAIKEAGEFLKKLRLDGKTVSDAEKGGSIMREGFPDDSRGIKRALSKYGVSGVSAAACMAFVSGDYDAPDRLDAVLSSGECYSRAQLAVSGKDASKAGIPEGKETGRALDILLNYIIDNPEDNTGEKLLPMLKSLAK